MPATQVQMNLADARAQLATAQANLSTTQAAIASEVATNTANLAPLNLQVQTLPPKISFLSLQASNPTQMSQAEAQAQLAAAQSLYASALASIASENTRHNSVLAPLLPQLQQFSAQIVYLQDQITEILAAVLVTMTPKPSSVPGLGTADFTAAVTGDPEAAGVTWELSGGGGLSATSGPSTTYTAPAAKKPPQITDYDAQIIARSVTNTNAFDSVQFIIPVEA